MGSKAATGIVLTLIAAGAVSAGLVSRPALAARTAARQSSPPPPTAVDPYQRSVEIYDMKTTAANGPQRGEEIYYYKCWFCHNKYAKAGPPLKGLFARPTLLSGGAVTDTSVAGKIRAGGPAMPAYRNALTEADLADLLSYFKDPRCCFEGDEPPPNPRYRATASEPSGGRERGEP